MAAHMREARARIAVALDVDSLEQAVDFARTVAPFVGVVKVGLELFVRYGPRAVDELKAAGAERVFLDLKLCDIPETVRRSVRAASMLGVDYLTVHAGGGSEMLSAAESEAKGLRLLAVTVLTSMNDAHLRELGLAAGTAEHALRLQKLAFGAGIRGFVCSPLEAPALLAAHPNVLLATPGIRPEGGALGDQQRVTTAADAIRAGAGLLVVGRPLRDATDRAAAAAELLAEVEGALQ